MFLPAHLVAGLIIGKLTGNYTVSLISSMVVDLDHLLAYYRGGILLKFKKMVIASTTKADSIVNQRNIFHNIFFVLAVSTIIILINFKVGLVFFLACLSHLLLDSLDDSNYFPFYPNKKINLRGPIKYFSKQEFIFTLILFIIFFLI